MKKYLVVLLLSVLSLGGYAQKYACVDTEYILSNVPEYKQAQKELEEVSVQWQKEVEVKFQAVDRLYKAFQAEAVILPADLKAQKENEIIAAEKEAKNLQKQRFGNDGDLAKKRSELVKPIQDRIYNAIEKVAQEKNYSVVFDKAGGATILYVDNKTDISDLVLAELGYKISSQKR
ncbi:MAG: OmpH family outer membrane protein [Bacteroidales bacterium]|nr:OmpH family outer membrane protein [Bacteroidales bacterium]MEE0937013.1 OmpH family outer membrane protein [Bacteroidales bacterium]